MKIKNLKEFKIFFRKSIAFLEICKYILFKLKFILKNNKDFTMNDKYSTISIPRKALELIAPLRERYMTKLGIHLSRGETVLQALANEIKRGRR